MLIHRTVITWRQSPRVLHQGFRADQIPVWFGSIQVMARLGMRRPHGGARLDTTHGSRKPYGPPGQAVRDTPHG